MCPEFKSLRWHYFSANAPAFSPVFCMQSSALFKEVERFFDSFLPNRPTVSAVVVAISGGSDSVSLFHALFSLKDRLGIGRLGIAHVNHALRGKESDEDAAFVELMARQWGVPFHLKKLEPRPDKKGLELWARTQRYGFFNHLMKTEGYAYIATGHTADDQAETVLMRFMRGCGLKGLRGIAPVRQDGVIRPLLFLPRNDLRAWLSETNRPFREDASNRSLDFTRNRVRHELLPAIQAIEPGAASSLTRIAESARAAWNTLLPLINTWARRYVVTVDEGCFFIKKAGLLDEPIAQEAVAQLFREKGVEVVRRHLDGLMANCRRNRGIFLLKSGWRYGCGRNAIEFVKGKNGPGQTKGSPQTAFCVPMNVAGPTHYAPGNVVFESERFPRNTTPLSFAPDNMTVFLDEETSAGPMEFRSLQPDDVFWPLGSEGFRNVKEYLKKRATGHGVIGVVAKTGGEILWIPGVQISHNARVVPRTRAIIKISCKILE